MIKKVHSQSDINKCFEIRRKVFIEEQKVPESEEFDDYETICNHYLVFNGKEVIGTARTRKTSSGYKMERIAILKEQRKKGFGAKLVKNLLTRIKKNASSKIYLSAQVQAIGFYEKLGFLRKGETYLDANIEHIEMEYAKKNENSKK
jgi:predicted GNAT family N-acyltransferase